MSEEARRRTDEALRTSSLVDMRPAYRKLLVRLKKARPEAFEEATRRYRDEVEPAIAAGDSDPIAAWLEYGRWIADRIAGGRTVTVDRSGRSRPFDAADTAGIESLVLHLPDDDRAGAILLAAPREASESQRLTAELLVR